MKAASRTGPTQRIYLSIKQGSRSVERVPVELITISHVYNRRYLVLSAGKHIIRGLSATGLDALYRSLLILASAMRPNSRASYMPRVVEP